MRKIARTFAVIAPVVIALAAARNARAEDPEFRLSVGGAHAIGSPQSSEFGFGGGILGSAAYPFTNTIAAQFELGFLGLANGSRPSDPTIATHGSGALVSAMIGLRARPFGESRVDGLWVDGDLGYALTGNASRFGIDLHAGYDFRIGDPHESRWDVGPFVGYTQIVQPDDTLRPADAHILWIGVQGGLGRLVPMPPPPPPTDRDGDGIYDQEDACPDVRGIPTNDPRTNGCPLGDRDKDGVNDVDDACPDVAGIKTDNPKTNGCPRMDKDGDGIFDDEDACPDQAGVRTDDPKTNGCPPGDRDNDTVLDNEDACPDVPGVRTEDPKTNGCPASEGHVRLEGDKIVLDEVILFDTDSPRVRHVSWPIVERIAAFITKTPDVLEVDIAGFADAVGTPEHNLQLSRERAQAVKHLLVQFGVKPERLTTHAFGETHPRVAVRKEEQANRRVEFTVTRAALGHGTAPAKGAKPSAPTVAPKGATKP